jgi:hypothetical protein
MRVYTLSHVSDQALLAELAALVAADGETTAALLAHIAEVDARQLYLPAACASMYVYTTRVLHLAEDAAFKRIRAARTARRFPQIFGAIADGTLHLSGVLLLAPHLTDDNADELLAAAAHKSKVEIELLLAQHRPRPDVPTRLEPAPAASPTAEQAPGPVKEAPPSTARVTPLSPQRFALQITIDQATQEKLLRARDLLISQISEGRSVALLRTPAVRKPAGFRDVQPSIKIGWRRILPPNPPSGNPDKASSTVTPSGLWLGARGSGAPPKLCQRRERGETPAVSRSPCASPRRGAPF